MSGTESDKFFSMHCTLTENESIRRRAFLTEQLWDRATAVRKLDDGHAVRFDIDDLDKLIEFIRFERECCCFITFGLDFEAQQGPVWLIWRVPSGTTTRIFPGIVDLLERLGGAN